MPTTVLCVAQGMRRRDCGAGSASGSGCSAVGGWRNLPSSSSAAMTSPRRTPLPVRVRARVAVRCVRLAMHIPGIEQLQRTNDGKRRLAGRCGLAALQPDQRRVRVPRPLLQLPCNARVLVLHWAVAKGGSVAILVRSCWLDCCVMPASKQQQLGQGQTRTHSGCWMLCSSPAGP